MDKFLKVFKAEIKSTKKEDFTVTAVVSTKKVDRDGDIVLPDAFSKRLKTFKDHPILLSSHTYSDLRKQIGEVANLKITDTGLEADLKYYVGQGNPEADWAWVLAEKGIASFSIGFIGHAYDFIEEKDEASGTKFVSGRKFTDVELLEISQVTVPSNRGALQMGRSMANETAELCEMAIKSFDKGDLKEAAPEVKKEAQKEHYSDAILEPGTEKSTQAQQEEQKLDVKEVVKQTIGSLIQEGKH